MRFLWRAVALLAAASSIALASVPASAQSFRDNQSFFEKLFGIGAAAPRAEPPQVRRSALRGTEGSRSERRRAGRDDNDDDRRGRRYSSDDGSGKVRTVCVRLCDGFYWPISNATSRRNLARDAGKCRASCGEEAVLYHEPAPGGDADKMVDAGGRPYTELRNAFLYRKTRIEACTCKPEPWSEASLERHREYAAIDAARKAELAARMRPVLVAADMTPRTGRPVDTALDLPRNQPIHLAADSTPGQTMPLTIAALVAASLASNPTADAAVANRAPEVPAAELVLFSADLSAPARAIETQLAGAEVKPAEGPAAIASSAVPAPDDPIVDTRRETVVAAAPAPPATKARRDEGSDTRKASQRTAHAERPRQPAPQRAAKMASAAPSWLGLKPKYTYPGDAPSRYR